MQDADSDLNWHDEGNKLLRMITAFVVEYAPLVADADPRSLWAMEDLRSTAQDLLQAIMNSNDEKTAALCDEARLLLLELLRYAG
ncbi:MAG TPA: hypothetical protein VFE47_22945 [Tepidisphaeraceae bacterium]|jgi:hypothetical protein|nr:hypothetical protein [Tepidisphaeraceae bacterium]